MAVVAQVVTLVRMTHRPRRPGADTAQSVRYSQPPVIEVVGSKRGRTESKSGFVKLPVTAKPKSAPPVPKVQQSPKAQVAEAMAQHVVEVIGVKGPKAKSMAPTPVKKRPNEKSPPRGAETSREPEVHEVGDGEPRLIIFIMLL